jgi:hypothetical protein
MADEPMLRPTCSSEIKGIKMTIPTIPGNIRARVSWPSLNANIHFSFLDNVNPELSSALIDAMPLEGIASHSVASGLDLTLWTPVYALVSAPVSERIDQMPVGRVFAASTGSKILFKHGPQTETVSMPPIGQVDDGDLELLQEVGRRVWEAVFFTKELIFMRIEVSSRG